MKSEDFIVLETRLSCRYNLGN